MALRVRRAVCACLGSVACVLAAASPALADSNVIPIAGGGAALGDGGLANVAKLAGPRSVALVHSYDFFDRQISYEIADYDNCAVREVGYPDSQQGSDIGKIATVVGTGACGPSTSPTSPIVGTTYKLDHPSSVSSTPQEQILIADSRNQRVVRYSPFENPGQYDDGLVTVQDPGAAQASGTVKTLAGSSAGNCSVAANGSSATAAKFCDLWRVAAHPWFFTPSSDAGYHPDKRFLVIDGGCAGGDGNCAVGNPVDPRVYMVWYDAATNGWLIRTVTVGCQPVETRGACFTRPSGVTFTGRNEHEFLVTDGAKNQVQRYDVDDPTVAEVMAGTGQATNGSNLGDDGDPKNATFSEPGDVVMTGDGYYVADTFNCLIRKVTDVDTAQNPVIFSVGGTCGSGQPDQATHSAFDADLWPAGLALGPAGLYVADYVTHQIKLFDRTTITSGPSAFSNRPRPSFTIESLEGYNTFVCDWDRGLDSSNEFIFPSTHAVCGTTENSGSSAVQIPPDGQAAFGDGPHRFFACIAPTVSDPPGAPAPTDCNYGQDPGVSPAAQYADPTPAVWIWTVDTAAPTGLAQTSPDDNAFGQPASPTFAWHSADGGPSGTTGYELWIDGKKDRDVPLTACNGSACSTQPSAPLGEAKHTWSVRATDGAGNVAATGERTLSSGSPPTAAFSIAPNPVLVGGTVTFDGSGSSDANGPIKRYEWDLDGDGSFETDSGAVAQVAKSYGSSGSVAVQLRVTDGVGLTAIATGTVVVSSATIAGQLGVTINNAAQYTNTPEVTVSVSAPASVTQLLVSNDGGFLKAATFAPAKTVKWHLDSSGPERLPKTVYVRFASGPITSPNYTDDIILDERPPLVQQAAVAPAAAAAVNAARLRSWKLKVKATDSNSGVGFVQVTVNKTKPGKLLKYKRKLSVKSATRPRFLRARDHAGNFSGWKKLR
ncbi:MAG: hypothetical protein QOJ29_446 [Thermoleophilaceae bacterium]|nr:hypothetical protein [Thermoleophilaceae bacterium]